MRLVDRIAIRSKSTASAVYFIEDLNTPHVWLERKTG